MAQAILFLQSLLLITILTNHPNVVNSAAEVKRTSVSSRGTECATPCATKGSDYFWCRLVNGKWDYCSKSPLLDYKGNKCENKCGRHGKNYNWCWTKNGEWGYCSSEGYEVYVQHFGSKTGKECSSTCSQHTNTKYHWCQVDDSWDYCSPNTGRNAAGTECATDCGKAEETEYSWCNDKNGKWQYCSSISTNFKGNCSSAPLNYPEPPSAQFNNKPIQSSTIKPTVPPFNNKPRVNKRSTSYSINGNDVLGKEDLCQQLAGNVLAKKPNLKEMSLPSGPDSPVVQVWHSEEGGGKLPHIIHSVIYQRHRKCPKSKFGDIFTKQMAFMDGREGDEKSHIVSSRLCGPAEWYNFSPQKSENRDESWSTQEEWFTDMLDHNPCVYLDHWAILLYDGGDRRPEHFQLCYAFKDVVTNRLMYGPDTKLLRNE